jgi:hypothetical protein
MKTTYKPTAETTPNPAIIVTPTVEVSPALAAGDTVKHANETEYKILHITEEGVALEGVANLVHPSALTKV